MRPTFRVPLVGALLLLLAAALIASLVPAGLALDRQVTRELRRAAVEDLGRAPMILEDRNTARAEALAMHAMSVAGTEGLVEAMGRGQVDEAVELAQGTASMYGEEPVLLTVDGSPLVGPSVDSSVLAALRRGESRVEYVYEDGVPRAVGLVRLGTGADWMGAAGAASPLAGELSTTLAALARADVTIVGADGSLVASTLDESAAQVLVESEARGGRAETEKVQEVQVNGAATWVARGELAQAGIVLFSRSVEDELAALPGVRRGALLAGILTLVLALGVGSLFAVTLTRPVRGLAEAAGRVKEGDFRAPVPASRVDEVNRLGDAFLSMREGLRQRLEELAAANRELEEKQERLHQLQAELIRQDRVASSARMAAELAHEIRNPVANVRNCLEVVRRSLPAGSDSIRFADLAIDELLRMHEMAEHLLDLNRPADPGAGTCDAGRIASQVASLEAVGEDPVTVETHVAEGPEPMAAIPPDALKQILFNLVENAREAAGPGKSVEVRVATGEAGVSLEVLDRGPGIPDEVLPQIFDPFFTTKNAVTGVGLGLSVAQGLVRRHGGRMEVSNREGGGARFRVEVPRAREEEA